MEEFKTVLQVFTRWHTLTANERLSHIELTFYRDLFKQKGLNMTERQMTLFVTYYFNIKPDIKDVSFHVSLLLYCYFRDKGIKLELYKIKSSLYRDQLFGLIKINNLYYDLLSSEGFSNIEDFIFYGKEDEVSLVREKTLSRYSPLTLIGRLLYRLSNHLYKECMDNTYREIVVPKRENVY